MSFVFKFFVASFLVIGLLFNNEVTAATFTSASAGAWTTSTNWSPAGVPTANDIIIINHAMTIASGTFTGWTGGTSVTINSGGSLTISGNLTTVGNGVNFIVNSGGTFEVTGTLTIDNQSKVTLQGGALKAGNLTLPDNSSSQIAYTSGTVTVTGNLFIGAAETFAYSSSLSVPGNITIKNGSTYSIGSLGGTITLSNASKLNLTAGTLSPSSISVSGSNTELNIAGASVTYANALTISGSSKLTVTSGTFTVNNTLAIDGGTFSSVAGSTTNASSLNVTNSGSTSFTNGGTFNVTGTVTAGGTITNNGTMNVGGDYNAGGSGSSITNQNGTMTIAGSVDLPSASKFQVNPGAVTTVNTNVTTRANENLIVGTDPTPPSYSDMIIKGNLISQGSGDILVDTNGRLAVYGNFSTNSGGGSIFTLDPGGKVFVNGTITFNGGGDHLKNNNTGVPYGFYSNNQPVYNGGGSSSNGPAAGNSVQSVATMQTDASSFYNWIVSQSGNPLPVTLLYFRLEGVSANAISLTWATATELNFDYFLLERSSDGKEFEQVAILRGNGTTNVQHDYVFKDENPLIGKSYYKLTSVDFDGYRESFDLVLAEVSGSRTARVYPNPIVDSQIYIDLNFQPTDELSVVITDLTGTVVGNAMISAVQNRIEVQVEPGTYLLAIKSKDITQITRIVVR